MEKTPGQAGGFLGSGSAPATMLYDFHLGSKRMPFKIVVGGCSLGRGQVGSSSHSTQLLALPEMSPDFLFPSWFVAARTMDFKEHLPSGAPAPTPSEAVITLPKAGRISFYVWKATACHSGHQMGPRQGTPPRRACTFCVNPVWHLCSLPFLRDLTPEGSDCRDHPF